jgi:hypothetical protein
MVLVGVVSTSMDVDRSPTGVPLFNSVVFPALGPPAGGGTDSEELTVSDDEKKQPTRRTRKKPEDAPAEATTDQTVDAEPETSGAAEASGVMTTESSWTATGDDSDDPVSLNRSLFGELVVHYPERDVTIVLDGASASKVMAVHAGVSPRLAMQDRLEPLRADMTSMWASIDMDRALAMSWIPGLGPLSTRKMTIDPEVPDALQR